MSDYPIRMKLDPSTRTIRRFEPLAWNHSTVDTICPACKEWFQSGDVTTLIPIGPGADPEARAKALDRVYFTGVGVVVHWACATGEESV